MEEIWKDILNYEGIYQVSSLGRVKSFDMQVWSGTVYYTKKGRVLRAGVNKNGYYSVVLCKDRVQKSYDVHRLVALSFIRIDNERGCVNHKDMNRLNNNIENLEWVSIRENNTHRHLNKTEKTSKYVGVFKWKHSNLWVAIMGKNKRKYFKTEEEAHRSYLKFLSDNNFENKYAQ